MRHRSREEREDAGRCGQEHDEPRVRQVPRRCASFSRSAVYRPAAFAVPGRLVRCRVPTSAFPSSRLTKARSRRRVHARATRVVAIIRHRARRVVARACSSRCSGYCSFVPTGAESPVADFWSRSSRRLVCLAAVESGGHERAPAPTPAPRPGREPGEDRVRPGLGHPRSWRHGPASTGAFRTRPRRSGRSAGGRRNLPRRGPASGRPPSSARRARSPTAAPSERAARKDERGLPDAQRVGAGAPARPARAGDRLDSRRARSPRGPVRWRSTTARRWRGAGPWW